jgi:hypothetical protein
MTVRPDVTSYAISSVTGQALTVATAGVTAQYTVTSKDASGNIRDSDGDAYLVYAASATGASFAGTVRYSSGGLYVVQYTPTVQGAYVLKTYLGTADKTTALTVYPGAACASLSLANSNYLSVSTAGYISEFSVQCKDSYNNLRTVSVDNWIVRVKGNSSSNSEEQHDSRVRVASQSGGSQVYQLGKYNALYRTTKSGAFSVNVMLTHTQGLNATYFRDLQFSNIAHNAIEFNTASFNIDTWGLGTPNSQVGVVDNWSVMWTGYLLQDLAPSLSFVTFTVLPQTVSTDKVRLWIDDRFIIDQNDGGSKSRGSFNVKKITDKTDFYYLRISDRSGNGDRIRAELVGSDGYRLDWVGFGEIFTGPIHEGNLGETDYLRVEVSFFMRVLCAFLLHVALRRARCSSFFLLFVSRTLSKSIIFPL